MGLTDPAGPRVAVYGDSNCLDAARNAGYVQRDRELPRGCATPPPHHHHIPVYIRCNTGLWWRGGGLAGSGRQPSWRCQKSDGVGGLSAHDRRLHGCCSLTSRAVGLRGARGP